MFCVLPQTGKPKKEEKKPVSIEEYKKALETVNNYNNM